MQRELKSLVQSIHAMYRDNSVSKAKVEGFIHSLEELGFSYDYELFPSIAATDYQDNRHGLHAPSNLAEALLWKMGKWSIYKNFLEHYHDDKATPEMPGGLVFHAFARHLKESSVIFDQHSLRSVWVINYNLDEQSKNHFKSYLMRLNRQTHQFEWKGSGTGDSGIECYIIFKRIMASMSVVEEVTTDDLDKLFMPLGKAIKKNFQNYDELQDLFA